MSQGSLHIPYSPRPAVKPLEQGEDFKVRNVRIFFFFRRGQNQAQRGLEQPPPSHSPCTLTPRQTGGEPALFLRGTLPIPEGMGVAA